MEGTGLTPADFEQDTFELWPENHRAFEIYRSLQTQWRTSGTGAYSGLDYNVLYKKLDRLQLTPAEYDQLETDIQVIEISAMQILNKSKS